jgi:hypothetical protein
MIEGNARYDGKVIVPDTPLNLPTNARLQISVRQIEAPVAPPERPKTDFSEWLGLGLREPQNPNPRFPDDDSLWEGSIGDTLINDPRKNRRL